MILILPELVNTVLRDISRLLYVHQLGGGGVHPFIGSPFSDLAREFVQRFPGGVKQGGCIEYALDTLGTSLRNCAGQVVHTLGGGGQHPCIKSIFKILGEIISRFPGGVKQP